MIPYSTDFFLFHYKLSLILTSVTNVVLAVFVLSKNSRNIANRLYAAFTFSVAVWSCTQLLIGTWGQPSTWLRIAQIEHWGHVFIPTFFLHFVHALVGIPRARRLVASYVISSFFFCLVPTRFMLDGIDGSAIAKFALTVGPLYPVYILWFIGTVIEAFVKLGKAIIDRKGGQQEQSKLKFVFWGSLVGYTGGLPNFLYVYDINLYPIIPFSTYLVPIYPIVMGYAIVKHQVLDIHVVIRRGILVSIVLAMLVAGYCGLIYTSQQLFEMTLAQHHILALALTSLTTFGLGLLVFLAGPRRQLNQVFGLYSLAISWWAFCEAFMVGAPDQPTANFWSYVDWLGILFIAPTFIHTVFLSTDEHRKYARRTTQVAYTLSAAFLFVHLFTRVLTEHPRPVGYTPYHNQVTLLGGVVPLLFLILVNLGLWRLWCAYRNATGQRKMQLKFLFWASLIGYLGGSPDWFFVFGFCVPPVNPFGIYSVPLYSIATTYAVFHHKLFDVNLVIRRSLVYSILITLWAVSYSGLVYVIEWGWRTTLGYKSIWLSVGIFALMALIFQPLKIIIQRFVDWLFFGAPREGMAKQVDRLRQEIRQADRLKAIPLLAAGLAHEIKNPLTILQTFTEFLTERWRDPEFQEKFQRLVPPQVDRIDQLVRTLLDFAKPTPPQPQPTPVSRLLDDTLGFMSSGTVRRHVEIVRSYAVEPDIIHADPQQLRQVFLNLLLNSLEAMDGNGGGRLCVSTAQQNGHVSITIEDTGPGIPQEHLKRMFEPFFTTKKTGTGIGLFVVKGIVTDHRGTIRFDSEVGHGTRCTLTFPLVSEDVKPQGKTGDRPATDDPARGAGGRGGDEPRTPQE